MATTPLGGNVDGPGVKKALNLRRKTRVRIDRTVPRPFVAS